MEDTRWLRLVTIGIVLAAVAVGYFVLAQRFSGNGVSEPQPEVVIATPPSVLGTDDGQSPQPQPLGQAQKSAYQRIAERTKGSVQELPATGFPLILIGIFSAGVLVVGWHLRKFSH